MIRWVCGVALILYFSLLVTPQVGAAHALHLTPLADSQVQAISPLTGQLSFAGEQDSGDDSDHGLPVAVSINLLYLSQVGSTLPAEIILLQPKTAHPVRAPPFYSLT